ncbi:MAG: DUF1365 domain-containing protein [Henriciella sp.]|nr:DUF1365 domain-containing protein [Henriciella sp.]
MNNTNIIQPPAMRLYRGHTTHQRSTPFKHRFRYGLSLIDIDIDRLDEAAVQSRLFSIEKPNLFSFRREDHGLRKKAALRPWAERQFADGGITLDGGPIRLVTFPRHIFYKFAPISLWFGHGPDGELRGILYEVNNTFGEHHTYVAATPDTLRHQHAADKVFHVSPFFDLSGRYHFTLRKTEDRLSLIVETRHGEAQTHVATIQAKASPATTPMFARLATLKPLSSLAVTLAIHWQALKLVFKGARYHNRPAKPDQPNTFAKTTGHPRPARETAA